MKKRDEMENITLILLAIGFVAFVFWGFLFWLLYKLVTLIFIPLIV